MILALHQYLAFCLTAPAIIAGFILTLFFIIWLRNSL